MGARTSAQQPLLRHATYMLHVFHTPACQPFWATIQRGQSGEIASIEVVVLHSAVYNSKNCEECGRSVVGWLESETRGETSERNGKIARHFRFATASSSKSSSSTRRSADHLGLEVLLFRDIFANFSEQVGSRGRGRDEIFFS